MSNEEVEEMDAREIPDEDVIDDEIEFTITRMFTFKLSKALHFGKATFSHAN
jgi:hypothetical protein